MAHSLYICLLYAILLSQVDMLKPTPKGCLDGSHRQLRSVAMISCCVIVLDSRRHHGALTRRWDALWFAQSLSHGLMEVSRIIFLV